MIRPLARSAAVAAAITALTVAAAQARDVTEQDARRIAAATASADAKSVKEIYLVIRGDTGGCGRIQAPTWFVTFKEGMQVYVDARTGKVRDCRL